jgi:acyl-CoA thioesterase-2
MTGQERTDMNRIDSPERIAAVSNDAEGAARSSGREILTLEAIGEDRFTGSASDLNHSGSVFGGRIVAQALMSAIRTVETMPPTSLHSYFLAPTLVSEPIEYRVSRLRDSRRFANRQVTAMQGGKAVFTLLCQFHAPEEGFTHQAVEMPDVRPPEALPPLQRFVREHREQLDTATIHNFSRALPIEIRVVEPEKFFLDRRRSTVRDFWLHAPDAAGLDDPRAHACLLAYASDYWLVGVAAAPHTLPTSNGQLLISSLDHAMWFHGAVRADQWFLHHTRSPVAGDGLGMAHGEIFDRDGRLVASTVQEGLLRSLVPAAAK